MIVHGRGQPITNPYHGGSMLTVRNHWCFWRLPDLTIRYHSADLAWPLSCGGFTRLDLRGYRPLLCAGYDGDLCHIAGMIWPTMLINESLGVLYSMEVAGVLCETFECCLSIDHTVQALRHYDLHWLCDL